MVSHPVERNFGSTYADPVLAPHFGALAVLLSWLAMTFLIGRLPSIGVYVYMIVHVIKVKLSSEQQASE